MKSIFLALSLLASTFTTTYVTTASASETPNLRIAQLHVFEINDRHFPRLQVSSAGILVDGNSQMVRLNVVGKDTLKLHCKATNPVCVVDDDTVSIELPIISTTPSRCGQVIVAEQDDTPRDGLKRSIVIEENGTSCDLRYPTTVSYTTYGFDRILKQEIQLTSTLRGDALRPIMFHMITQ